MNEKNQLGINSCFLNLDDPIKLFEIWMEKAKQTEPNDPNAVALATSSKNNVPSVRMVLLKDFNKDGFVFYTNLNSRKGNELKENPNASMCFHWKSLLRQVRITGTVSLVSDDVADEYYSSRAYESRIGAWASNQSQELKNRDELINSIKVYKNQYSDETKVPRPKHWSGWNLNPQNIEFWLDGENRIHERLLYTKSQNGLWNKALLSP
ncbi:pyridoxamine 5'-phosphate oxidase [Candidatus Pelagibacter sp. HIMB1593]|uniref:pyridoxamine 5'-phosphate oxidase n=1 Tax=Candidatus Pelagibacter sp. HIMB1593 TaxID=3413355 RepID=UPI003F864542